MFVYRRYLESQVRTQRGYVLNGCVFVVMTGEERKGK